MWKSTAHIIEWHDLHLPCDYCLCFVFFRSFVVFFITILVSERKLLESLVYMVVFDKQRILIGADKENNK